MQLPRFIRVKLVKRYVSSPRSDLRKLKKSTAICEIISWKLQCLMRFGLHDDDDGRMEREGEGAKMVVAIPAAIVRDRIKIEETLRRI